MAEVKRKNKPGPGGVRPGSGRKPSGRNTRINARVLDAIGKEMKAQANKEGMAPMLERLWAERKPL